jgi:hypothetical protein
MRLACEPGRALSAKFTERLLDRALHQHEETVALQQVLVRRPGDHFT